MGWGMYVLGGPDGHTPIPESDALVWAEWFETAERHVASTRIGNVWVSTVFLGLDHNYSGGQPILFETMIFQGKKALGLPYEYQKRYSTWEEAVQGHRKAVKYVKDQILLGKKGVDYAKRIQTKDDLDTGG